MIKELPYLHELKIIKMNLFHYLQQTISIFVLTFRVTVFRQFYFALKIHQPTTC